MGGLMDKEGIILRIRDVISSLPSLRVAYLYGSFLSLDDFRDIDIALLIDDGPGEEHSVEFAAHVGNILEEALGFCHECDVRVLNDEPVWFKYEIISTGMPIYIRNEDDRIDFETRVLVEYQDIKFMYDLFDEEYLAQV
jgi:predicted nucleotidyltransferase